MHRTILTSLSIITVHCALTAQQRVTLTDLDQRLTVLEQAPTPEQIAINRWFAARSGVSFNVGHVPAALVFDGADIWIANTSQLIQMHANNGAVVNTYPDPGSAFALA